MKRKNTLTIAITKYYDIKVEANESDLAWDEYMNNSGKRNSKGLIWVKLK